MQCISEKPGCWVKDLREEQATVQWVWPGLLADGNVTLLTSQSKSGKTTLLSILLARLLHGGQLAGLPVAPRRAMVLSEEGEHLWARRHQHCDLSAVYLVCKPFRGKPTVEQWHAQIDRVLELQAREGIGLLAVDTVTALFPHGNEASASGAMAALLPLGALTERGMAVLLLHHPSKGRCLPGLAARGTSALTAATDINLEMRCYGRGDRKDRRRRITGYSRYDETPSQLVLELNGEGTDYTVHDDLADESFAQSWVELETVLRDAGGKRTRQELRKEWPADFVESSDVTLFRWLQDAVFVGKLCVEGSGRKSDPFRYWLPGKLEEWANDPIYQLRRQMGEER